MTDESPHVASPTVAVPQVAVDDLAPERNLDRIRDRTASLPDRVDVALFPEYALTGFVADDGVSDAALDRSWVVERLGAVARDNDVAVLAGFLESGDDDLYNATAYVSPERTDGEDTDDGSGDTDTAIYRKRHLWGEEASLLAAGRERVVVDTPAGPTGLLTCYDLNFVAESAWFTERSVDALFVAGAWPAAHTANWRLLLRARALDGVRWVVGAGRTGEQRTSSASGNGSAMGLGTGDGTEPPTRYAGNSLVARPDGRVASALGRERADLVATLDRETLATQRDLVGAVDTEN